MPSFDSIRQFVRVHPWKVSLVAIAAILYIAFNVWFYFFTISGGLKANPAATITERIKRVASQSPTSPSPDGPTPPPTPTPKTGPGPHGCDPYGVCNLYQPDLLKEACIVTFADSACLGACSDPAKRCKK